RELSKQANETLKLKDNQNRPVVASFNQINGFFVVVEQVSNAKNELNTNKTASLEAITEAKTNANNEISTNKTQAITNINEIKESANNEISTNKTQAITNITQEKQQATSEIAEAKKTAFNELLETLKPKFSGLFAGAYYIHNVIYVNGGWEQKVKDLSDYTLEKSKKGE
ncbi:ATP synthase subunit B family protein, partial [Helicobacter pylori]